MSDAIQFREVRKGERGDVLAFAQAYGLTAEHTAMQHHLSLIAVGDENETLAAALCLTDRENRLVIEVISGGDTVDDALISELADRCLRKVQAETIRSARLRSPICGSVNTIWSSANWLDHVQEAAPPETDKPADAQTQAA